VEALLSSGLTQKMFAKQWGVSLPSLTQWLAKYRSEGPKGLERVAAGEPKRRGRAPVAEAVKRAIVETRERFPTFGLKRVRHFLARFRGLKVSTGSVKKTLRAEGIGPAPSAPARRRRRATEPKRFERARPGELWQSDITYLDVPWRKQPLYLVAFVDDHSRYVVSWGLHTSQRQEIVLEAFEAGALRFGKPLQCLTDQGRQYFAWRGKSAFQKHLAKEHVQHVVARAHHPETVGKCERLWETLKRELWDRVQPKDLEEARAALTHWFAHYNHFRPHGSLDGLTPADRFFGAKEEVRKAVERTMKENELRMALGQEPRTPLYFAAQIGEQSVSVHGERGRIVVQTQDGVRREIDAKDLGMPPARPAARPEPAKEPVAPREPERDEDRAASGGPVAGGGEGGPPPAPAAATPPTCANEGGVS
jgi:transposase InsO family protein